ncbi:butyrophilin subfamily 1 member A1-like [Oreochromis aureus]|uniref:butyrophilin subfamily 1 member A1-like n=1 Tax=Oreochromis aureus TaxID=47969 RepID=UPI001953834E|nr:butyrophilin subfamily 1 member A1-like [Oreochromis aureus]
MSPVTATLCGTLLCFSVFVFVSADLKMITAESGQDVTLTCRAPDNNINTLEWSRADLGDKNVYLYQNGHFEPDHQHPSVRNRVDLQNREMMDGDASLILKDVMIGDTGTYECRVNMEGKNRKDAKPVSVFYLHVDPPGAHKEIEPVKTDPPRVDPPAQTGGSGGLKAGLVVPAVLLVATVVGF